MIKQQVDFDAKPFNWVKRLPQRIAGRIKWGVFKRSSRILREGYQREEIRIINDYFLSGWFLLGGDGELPACKSLFSKCYAATVFFWENSKSKSYLYRIGNQKVEGGMGFYCVTTGETTLYEDDLGADYDTELVIAATAITSILYGHDFEPKQLEYVLVEIGKEWGINAD